jgi:mono/diheme cytochrome c family protein
MVWAKVVSGIAGMAVVAALLLAGGARSATDLELGKRVYKKANCVGCHKWHGGGGGGYGGAALSLRATQLDRDQLLEVVRCGRPGTRMPYHDRNAYKTTKCYDGMTKADLGDDFPAQAAIFLREQEIEAVVDYVQTDLQGKGEPTKADCIAFWGEGERQCQSMK